MNRAFLSLHGGPFEITRTVPLSGVFSYSEVLWASLYIYFKCMGFVSDYTPCPVIFNRLCEPPLYLIDYVNPRYI